MSERFFQARYLAHKYWGRRPWYAVRALIEEHSSPGEVVLDSFCGSGTTIVEALAAGRRAVGADLNPIAEFITRITVLPADTADLERGFARLRAAVQEEIDALYTREPDTIEPRHWYPTTELPVSVFGVHPKDAGMTCADLFSRRNLAASALLWDAIQTMEFPPPVRNLLQFTFTAALAQFTKMIRTKKEGTGWWVNAYRIPRSHRENNVWHSFENKLRAVMRMKQETNALLGPVTVSTAECPEPDAACTLRVGSATDLSFLPDESVDYIFVDPPWAIKYFDLSVLWCSWMGFALPFEQEIFPWHNEFRGDMERALRELARVLRPGRVLSLNFATRYMEVLNEWREAIEATGLDWVGTDALQQDQLSFVQRQHETTLKGNYLLTLRKHGGPAAGHAPKEQPAARVITPAEMESLVAALLRERGPLSYDAIFQALYPELARRPLACDLDVLLRSRFDYSNGDGSEGVYSISASNAGPPPAGSFRKATPMRSRRAKPEPEAELPFGEEEGAA